MGSGLVRVLIRNAASNWLGFAVQAAVAFFLTPFVLASLGSSRYGVWMLVGSLTGYYGLLDLGFRAGLTQYLTRYLATGDYQSLNKTASTGVVALACCGGIIFLAALGLAGLAPLVFHVPGDLGGEVRWAILINGSAVGLQFCLFPFSAVFTATQRYDLANGIGISTRLLGALGTYLALHLGYGLVGLSVVTAGANLLDYALRWRLAHWILPQLRVSLRTAALTYCWPLLSFGLWNVAIGASVQLTAYSGELIIGAFAGTAAITPYALALSLTTYYANLFVPIGTVFFPAATQLDAQRKTEEVRALYLWGSKMLVLLAGVSAVVMGFLAGDFYRLWIGPGLEEEGFTAPAALFRILLLGAACAAGQRVGYQVLLGARSLRLLALLLGGEAACCIALAVCLVPWLGPKGMAFAAGGTAVAFQAILHPWVLTQFLGIRWRDYLARVLFRSLLVCVLLACTLVLLRRLGSADTWPQLFLEGAVALGLAGFLILFFGIGSETRRKLFDRLGVAFPARDRVASECLLPIRSESQEAVVP
jgi:O-antigen/teichoic acid export membrane protein